MSDEISTDKPVSYWLAVARMGFEEDLWRICQDLGISRAEVAERLGVSTHYVSLNGTASDCTLEAMVK
jgi:predicted transcriptional regulator